MPFGKHKGKPVGKVLRKDLQYMQWISHNTSVEFEEEIQEIIDRQTTCDMEWKEHCRKRDAYQDREIDMSTDIEFWCRASPHSLMKHAEEHPEKYKDGDWKRICNAVELSETPGSGRCW